MDQILSQNSYESRPDLLTARQRAESGISLTNGSDANGNSTFSLDDDDSKLQFLQSFSISETQFVHVCRHQLGTGPRAVVIKLMRDKT